MASATQFIPSQSMNRKLKTIAPSQIPPLDAGCRSDAIHPSPVPSNVDPRSFYLDSARSARKEEQLLPPPLVSCSEFVPRQLVQLLMRKKKNSALGVKFIGKGGFRYSERDGPDQITNMEGAMHTFVTPVIGRCEMIGDYRYDGAGQGHGVCLFGAEDGNDRKNNVWLTRSVVMSASIHMDFEGARIMLRVCKLDGKEVLGSDLGADKGWEILSTEEKQDDKKRFDYDESLRQHMVFHLTEEGRLPARRAIKDAMDVKTAIEFLDEVIVSGGGIGEKMMHKYAELYNDQVVSLELLFNAAVHQVRNEFSALEALCPQGYAYTYDPASIFAREIGPPLLNRLMLSALRYLSDNNRFEKLKVFAFNDYAERSIMSLVVKALENQPAVRVVRKDELFRGPGGKYDVGRFKEAEGAMLVVHNNSDGFGQNIETEAEYGSLDGAIGSNSSAAGSLERQREDLLDFII